MIGKKKFTIDPVGRDIKFKFDKDSTKDFGGMIVDRKPSTEGRIPRQKPVTGSGKPRKDVVTPPKGGSGMAMGNREQRNRNQAPSSKAADRYKQMMLKRKKSAKKRPPFIVDTFKG